MRDPVCKFCRIVAGELPASIIYQDDEVVALMNIRAVNRGECMVMPRQHIDHFTDIPDALAARILLVAQRIGRRIRRLHKPQRIGYVVHGYGIPHAHFLVVPQNDPNDITSRQFIELVDGEIRFTTRNLPLIARDDLDNMAAELAIEDPPTLRLSTEPRPDERGHDDDSR
jgi:histidine triad (HIT) family protein